MHEGEYEAMYGLENSYWWYVARRILAEELLSSETNGRKSVRILDVGCGTGANMCAFERQGTTTGVDTSIEALTFCRTRGLQRLVLSAVEKLPFDDQTFHAVTALDVLEHTDDDLNALREIQRVCHKGGYCWLPCQPTDSCGASMTKHSSIGVDTRRMNYATS